MIQEKQLNLNDGLEVIETKLEAVFQPIKPRLSFVSDLRQLLDEEMAKRQKKAKVKKGLLVAGSVVGGVLMVAAIIRSLASWREIVQAIEEWISRQKQGQQAVSA